MNTGIQPGAFDRYKGMTGETLKAALPLEADTLRRFVQAIMDRDPLYFDAEHAASTRFGEIVAPPLYPVHAFRPTHDQPDPLDAIRDDPEADGSGGVDSMYFGLPAVEKTFTRLLNGGNEIEFFRCLAIGEKTVAKARYADVTLKEGKAGPMLLVVVETTFSTEAGERLLINRQTLILR